MSVRHACASGGKDFLVESLDASFRYPQDFSFHIQNFTTAVYNRVVEPKRQATFDYAFTPNEAFAGRPFGLVINLNYKDAVRSDSLHICLHVR